MINILLPNIFAILIIAFCIGVIALNKMLKLLKQKHHQKWIDLGKPTLLGNNSIANNQAVFQFLSKKEYEEIEDPDLNSICKFNKLFLEIYFCVFAVALVVFIFTT